ncbi:regulatory protein RecX [Schaalia georgiae F0490]|uniref:Regulatory protein RecX n=1 Tax=Schaalia georgiae F0490 TaxID=1125717 RepID=J0P2W5_9ACTO|nr:regulatory protein RecX [Schaalia georgiae]EJF51747.1 regulatory protein RecX [Schaalia georgiae F0490]
MEAYQDQEEDPGAPERPGPGEAREGRPSPAERARLMRERNAALEGPRAVEAAREVALRQLDTRARSRRELLGAIASRGFRDGVGQEVVARLEAVGLVDDRAFARALVRERFAARGRTGPALVAELRRKGLDGDTIDEAVSTISADDEYDRARRLVEDRARSVRGMPRRAAYRRLAGMLARKGYGPDVSARAVCEALDALGSGDGEDGPWQDGEAGWGA